MCERLSNDVLRGTGGMSRGPDNFPMRESAAQALLNYASKISSRADALTIMAKDRLQGVMRSDPPVPVKEKDMSAPAYPPLFDTLRLSLLSVERSLDAMESMLERTDI